jgi:hypothetical protein
MVTGGGRRWPPRWVLLFFLLCSTCCSCPPPPSPSPSRSSSSSSSGKRMGWRRPKRSQPKNRIFLVKRARLWRGEPGFECRERVSASAVVALVLPESARRSSRSLRSFLEERRHWRHGAVRARKESDHENDSMSFHVDGERSCDCENLETLWPQFHVTHTGTGFTSHQ